MAFAGNVDELALLQTIRLKGQVTADVLAAQLGVALASAEAARDALLAQGKAEETGDGAFALTDAGVAELGDQLDAERVSIDEDSIAEIHERFLELDGPLRELVEGDPNFEALAALDRKAQDVLDDVSAFVPRLSRYQDLFAEALRKAQAGDAAWIAAPEIASYATVWGEIARELRGACGLDEDAAA
ncbi:hypothetical protein GS436_13580 [Rhodococcus hoagii]|uniref:Uncharacterized protein n=1 Tax=Rhodococcus hoagii TaxID=43767 RepID=A0AAE3BBY7_RHOHA|nr:hypothetical protein [Prescottella equi]MBM4493970.1 hypothetical protein [Prescottella equi]MBM4510629.1 hypothetical protein [Prescottella equi]MBM4538165.1 hypothetical protein [Prescottella equi]MBM4716576.1 hypothetical protein [Prescottella equi]